MSSIVSDVAPRTFDVRHLQLARALFAAIAAVMITFSSDHSALVGVTVFSGWAMATSLVLLLSAWLVFPAGGRWQTVLLGVVTLAAGLVGSFPTLRTTAVFFVLVIAWALVSGALELFFGIAGRRRGDDQARDALLIGALTLALALGLLLVNPAYSLDYFVRDADQSFTLTGITIGVGLFGGYAAMVAVFLGIAGFSPRRPVPSAVEAPASRESAGGAA